MVIYYAHRMFCCSGANRPIGRCLRVGMYIPSPNYVLFTTAGRGECSMHMCNMCGRWGIEQGLL